MGWSVQMNMSCWPLLRYPYHFISFVRFWSCKSLYVRTLQCFTAMKLALPHKLFFHCGQGRMCCWRRPEFHLRKNHGLVWKPCGLYRLRSDNFAPRARARFVKPGSGEVPVFQWLHGVVTCGYTMWLHRVVPPSCIRSTRNGCRCAMFLVRGLNLLLFFPVPSGDQRCAGLSDWFHQSRNSGTLGGRILGNQWICELRIFFLEKQSFATSATFVICKELKLC